MKAFEYTPGPWTIEKRSIGANESSYYGKDRQYIGMFSFSVGRHEDMKKWKETGEANAKLIAAAPELLEALKECRKWYEENTDRIYPDTPICFSTALSLIQKATR